jgi:hypothetical protein
MSDQPEKVGYTAGPWEFRSPKDGVFASGDKRICDVRGWDHLIAGKNTDAEINEANEIFVANGRLIAAAPTMAAELSRLREALMSAIAIAEEARREWDAAPNGMRAGKILIALAGGCPGYRADIDAIHAIIAKAEGHV